MSLVKVFAPGLGRTVALGRRPPRPSGPAFRFARYKRDLPEPPPSVDYASSGDGALSAALADILGNDALGDCVIAMLLHLAALWTGNAGRTFVPTRAMAIAMYSAITGYNPADPSTDRGTDMTAAFDWICAHGFPNGDRPLGYLRVDATNRRELEQAIYLFEGCGFGIPLPDAYLASMPSADGFVWDVAGSPNPNNGHAFLGGGYNDQGVLIDTWGLRGTFTWSAIAAYAVAASGGEVDLLLSQDMIAAAATKSPAGFAWADLVADFDAMGGTVPAVPGPPVAPTPPGTPVTLPMAQGFVQAGMVLAHPLLTRQQAIDAAVAALAAGWPAS